MKRINILGAAMGTMAFVGSALSAGVHVAIDRDRPVSSKRKRIAKAKQPAGRSRYMPHIGAKEQERAKRCYMENGILQQMSVRQFEVMQDAESWF